MHNSRPMTGVEEIELEGPRRFSRSKLWQWQAEYFERSGMAAWAGTVPFFSTSNIFTAHCYAEVIVRYLQDIGRQPGIDPGRTVYIIELGAGSGQFSYYCIQHLAELCGSLQPPVQPRYVMTDFAQSNIDFWTGHEVFQPFIESGMLDMARFDLDRPGPLSLRHAGTTVSTDHPGGAVVCIANYLFDATRHDAFQLTDGLLHELLVSLAAPPESITHGRPARLADVEYRFTLGSAVNRGYYRDEIWDRLLAAYTEETGLTGSFVYPTAMLNALGYLEKLGDGKLMLLGSDKGYLSTEEIMHRPPPSLALHGGSFSLSANFDLMRRYTECKGGVSFHQPPADAMRTCAYIIGCHPTELPETRAAIRRFVQEWGPGDFFALYRQIRDSDDFDPRACLSLLRAGGWDPYIIGVLTERLYKRLAKADDRQRHALHQGLRTAETRVYARPGMKDPYFALGLLYYGLGDYTEASRLYERSLEFTGDEYKTYFNLGLAHHRAGNRQAAIDAFAQAWELETEGNDAETWLRRLQTVTRATDTGRTIMDGHRVSDPRTDCAPPGNEIAAGVVDSHTVSPGTGNPRC